MMKNFSGALFILVTFIIICAQSKKEQPKDEIVGIDIMTFIEEVNNEVLSYNAELNGLDLRTPLQISQNDPIMNEKLNATFKGIQDLLSAFEDEGVMDEEAQNCITEVLQFVIDSQTDYVLDLRTDCDVEDENLILLKQILGDMERLKHSSEALSGSLLSANLWCSTNFDSPDCYGQSGADVASKGMNILAEIKEIRAVAAEAITQSINKLVSCQDRISQNLDSTTLYVIERLTECIDL